MQLRPFAAQWFEVVVPRDDAHDTMETLARHAEVQFEWPGDPQTPAPLDPLREPVARYRRLAERYGQFWPSPGYPKRCCDLPLETEARIALNRIEHWLDAARPALDEHDRLRDERGPCWRGGNRSWPASTRPRSASDAWPAPAQCWSGSIST